MTPEILQRAKELEGLIPLLKQSIDQWERANGFKNVQLQYHENSHGYTDEYILPFDEIKPIVIKSLKRQLEEAEVEWDHL